MEQANLISNVINSMREYQKENNIKKQCVTNAQFLYDVINKNFNINVKTKAVIVFSYNIEEDNLIGGHIILTLSDGTVIEPSYDIFCLKNKSYFDNIKDFVNAFDDKVLLKSKIDIKQLIHNHIHFMKLSDRINNGKLTITDKTHYNKQADYIKKLY